MTDKTVLIVDDDQSLCDNLEDILQDEGYEPFSAVTYADGFKLAQKRRHKVALLDLKLPDGQGTALLSDLKRLYPDCLCIIMTAYADLDSAVVALQKAAYHYLQKPVHPAELLRVLEGAFETIHLRELKCQAEEALRKNEELLRDFLDNANDLIQIVEPDGQFLYINHRWLEVLGYTADETVNLSISDTIHPDSLAHCFEIFQRILAGEVIDRFETAFVTKDGKKVYVEGSINCRFENGKPVNTRGIFRDITERKRAEEKLLAAEAKYRQLYEKSSGREELYRSLLNSSPEAIMVYDMEGHTQYVNPAFTQIFGWSLEEVKGKKIPFVPDSVKEATMATILEVIHDGRPCRGFETKRYTKDGRILEVDISASHYDDHEGKPVGMLVVMRDISEQKKLEVQLRQAQKMEAIGTLAGGIAHDFNNILAAIMGYIEMASYDVSEQNQARQKLDKALKACSRAKDLVSHILAFSHKSEQQRKPVHAHLIVKEALTLLRASLPSTIEIHQNIVTESDTIMADPTQIHQVMMNLCTNADHAMGKKGGVLGVTLASVDLDEEATSFNDFLSGPYIKLTVSDTGHGMDHAVIDRIFDPYFTTKEKGVGTGLGLAVVQGIVKSHGGSIGVSSEPGKGTKFELLFPRLDEGICEKAGAPEVLLTGHESVLFVDDEEDLVETGKLMLERLGYEFVGKTSSVEALEVFRAQPEKFDLVITDQTMPNMAGTELSKELMRIRPDIPVILCTGYSKAISEDQVRALGIQEFIMKPITINDLAKIIRKVLDKKQSYKPGI